MGWNDVVPRDTETLFRGLGQPRYYFLHSYHIAPRNDGVILGSTDYLGMFASAVRSDNIYGVQFHPEKSHSWGVKLLQNFADL